MIFEYDWVRANVAEATPAIEVVPAEPQEGTWLDVQGNELEPICRGLVLTCVPSEGPQPAVTLTIMVEPQEGQADLIAWLSADGDVGVRISEDQVSGHPAPTY